MKTKLQLLTVFFSFFIYLSSSAQELDLDIINLKHRTADDIIPIIQPFLIPEAAVTARDYKLIIKSTPENIEEIKSIIEQVDAGLRQLKISVSIGHITEQVENKTQSQIMAEIKGDDTKIQVGTGNITDTGNVGTIVRGETNTAKSKVSGHARITSTSRNYEKPVTQTVRSTEGQWTTIRAGQSVPVVERIRNPDGTVTQTTRYHGATTGFKILSRLQPDNKVSLFIRPHSISVSSEGRGRFDVQSMETQVVGELGKWIQLGDLNELTTGQLITSSGSSQSHNKRSDSVFVKIELAQ